MKRATLCATTISLLVLSGQSEGIRHEESLRADRGIILENIEQMWVNMAQGKADPNKFDPEHNVTAYSSGGLWEDHTADELATALVGGSTILAVQPYHIKITLLGANDDVAHATYYLVGTILKDGNPIVTNYRTRISQVLEKQNGQWIFVANHASPLFGGSGVIFE